MTLTPGQHPDGRPDNPPPLITAASLVAVEGVLILLLGGAELVNLSTQRLTMGVTTTLFFVAYGGGLLWCAWALTRRISQARSPVLLAQLIQLGLAWSLRGGETTPAAVAMAVVAVVVLVGTLHPASLAALDDDTS